MAQQYVPQYTLQYKTWVKRSMVEALQEAFHNHPDPTVAGAKVALDYTENDFELPAVIIKFYEQSLDNAGVGHFEWGPISDAQPNIFIEYQHRMYKGNIEFEIFGMRTVDRDIISDAIVEVLAMDEVSAPGQSFLNRLFNERLGLPYGSSHFATLNVDQIEPYGEQMMQAPWSPEDDQVFQSAYRVPIFGEFYSYVPPTNATLGLVAEVDVYGYPVAEDNVTALDPLNQAPPALPETDTMKLKGNPVGTEEI